jgi:hypothetical protein
MAGFYEKWSDEQLNQALQKAQSLVDQGAQIQNMDAQQISELERHRQAVQDFSDELASRKTVENESSFFSDVVGRVGVGQGLAMGYGDEIEAYARSAFTDETYEEALKDVREKIETARRERPIETTGAELVGALVPAGVTVGSSLLTGGATTPAAAAAAGRTVGLASNLLRGTGRGALVGAGQGAIEGFGRGEGGFEQRQQKAEEDMLTGAAFGGGLGAGGEVVRAGLQSVFKSPESLARLHLLQKYAEDEVDPSEGLAAYKASQSSGAKPEIMADIYPGGPIAGETERLYQTASGAGRRKAYDQLMERARGQGSRMQTAFEEATGTRQGLFDTLDNLKEIRKTNAAPLYEKAYQIPISRQQRRSLDKIMLAADDDAWVELQKEARKEGLDFKNLVQTDRQGRRAIYGDYTIKDVDLLKRGLDRVISNNIKDGKLLPAATDAIDVKNALLKLADKISPEYKQARDAWAGPTAAMNAANQGKTLFTERSEQIIRDIKKMNASEKEAFLIGALDAVNQRLGRSTDLQDATRQFLTGNAQNQISAALTASGKTADEVKEISDALFKGIEREAQMSATKNAILGGSATARRLARSGEASNQLGAASNLFRSLGRGEPLSSALIEPFNRAATSLATGVTKTRTDKTNEILRNYLMSSTPAGVENMTRAMLEEAARVGRYAPTKALVPGLLAGPLRQMYENR